MSLLSGNDGLLTGSHAPSHWHLSQTTVIAWVQAEIEAGKVDCEMFLRTAWAAQWHAWVRDPRKASASTQGTLGCAGTSFTLWGFTAPWEPISGYGMAIDEEVVRSGQHTSAPDSGAGFWKPLRDVSCALGSSTLLLRVLPGLMSSLIPGDSTPGSLSPAPKILSAVGYYGYDQDLNVEIQV